MTYAELQERARAYLETFPDQTPEQIYINGFLSGFQVAQKENSADGDGQAKKEDVLPRGIYSAIRSEWNALCPAFAEVRSISEKRKEKIRARWREFAEVGDALNVCIAVFTKMQASDFLRGGNARGWKATFDWLFENSNNWVKVYEGQYDNREGANKGTKVNDYWD